MIKKQIYTQRILSSKSLLTHHSSHGHNCSHLWSIETLHTARWKLHLPSLKILHWYIEPFVKYCWFATPYFFFWHPVLGGWTNLLILMSYARRDVSTRSSNPWFNLWWMASNFNWSYLLLSLLVFFGIISSIGHVELSWFYFNSLTCWLLISFMYPLQIENIHNK